MEVLRRFQHCRGHITSGSWKGSGNQYIQFVRVLYCKLPTNGKQLPAFPLEAVPGTEPRPQRWEVRVLPLCHRGPTKLTVKWMHTVSINEISPVRHYQFLYVFLIKVHLMKVFTNFIFKKSEINLTKFNCCFEISFLKEFCPLMKTCVGLTYCIPDAKRGYYGFIIIVVCVRRDFLLATYSPHFFPDFFHISQVA